MNIYEKDQWKVRIQGKQTFLYYVNLCMLLRVMCKYTYIHFQNCIYKFM